MPYEVLFWSAVVVVVLFAMHRLAIRAERRGWIIYPGEAEVPGSG